MGNDVATTLKEATKAMTKMSVRLDTLEESSADRHTDLRDHIDDGFQQFDAQLGTMNAHLDNIARESQIANAHHDQTNKLLAADQADRKAERDRLLQIEEGERQRLQQLEDEDRQEAKEGREEAKEDQREVRALVVAAGKEAWLIFKQPLGYLVTAAVGFVGWYYFNQPMPQQADLDLPPTQVEQADLDLPPTQVEAHE